MGDRGHNRYAPKRGGLLCPFGGGPGSPSNTMSLGPRPTCLPRGILIHPAIWPQQIWAENWGALSLWGRGAGSPSNIMWPGPRPTCMPRFILIHPTVWPCSTPTSQTRQTDRQTDNGLIAEGEPFCKRSPRNEPTENLSNSYILEQSSNQSQ